MTARNGTERIRYGPDEACSPFIAGVVGLQGVALTIAPTILVVAVTVRAAGQDDAYQTWAVFGACVINAVIIGLHATRTPYLGAGHIVITAPTIQFVAVSVAALAEGSPATLAGLMVLSSAAQFGMALWLPALRRLLTPVVTGTVLMLVAASLLHVGTDRLNELPAGAQNAAGPAIAIATVAVAVVITLRASSTWRLWSTLISIAVGCALTAALGLYELEQVFDAPWAGIPEARLPGLNLTPGIEFWALLPTFLILTLVLSTKVVSDGALIERVSQPQPRAIDGRHIQAMVSTNGLGMLLAGIAGTPPVQTVGSFSTSLISLTGVASRRVGYAIAIIFLAVALFPKVGAILLTIPGPVIGAYLLLALGGIFVGGMQTVVQGGLDGQKSVVVGLALAVGLGLDKHEIITYVLGDTLGAVFGSGVMYGAIVAVGLTFFLEYTATRPRRLETELDVGEFPAIDKFLRELATDQQWDGPSTERLRSAGEETLSSLLDQDGDDARETTSSLVISARPGGASMELEFVATTDRENLEDQLAYLSDEVRLPEANEISLRLLRHYASSVRHQKYYGIDIVTVVVESTP